MYAEWRHEYVSIDDDGTPPEEDISKFRIVYDLTEEELKGLSPDDLYYNDDYNHYIDDGGILHQEESVLMEEDIIATGRIEKEDFVEAKLEVHDYYYYYSFSMEKWWLLAIAYYSTDDDGVPLEEAISYNNIIFFSRSNQRGIEEA